MSIENIHNLIKQAEIELAQLVEEQQKLQATKPRMYVFAYDQLFDTQEWGPSSQNIQGRNMEECFRIFGRIIDEMGLTVRNIHYGGWEEMQEEEDRISEYWRLEHAKRRVKPG
jgi:hypothetical protein